MSLVLEPIYRFEAHERRSPLDSGLPELDAGFPDVVLVLHWPAEDLYALAEVKGREETGLAVFSTQSTAREFERAAYADEETAPAILVSLSFDEARDLAQKRVPLLNALVLLDDLTNPRVHYVR
jgi:hypothetical protein